MTRTHNFLWNHDHWCGVYNFMIENQLQFTMQRCGSNSNIRVVGHEPVPMNWYSDNWN